MARSRLRDLPRSRLRLLPHAPQSQPCFTAPQSQPCFLQRPVCWGPPTVPRWRSELDKGQLRSFRSGSGSSGGGGGLDGSDAGAGSGQESCAKRVRERIVYCPNLMASSCCCSWLLLLLLLLLLRLSHFLYQVYRTYCCAYKAVLRGIVGGACTTQLAKLSFNHSNGCTHS